MTKMKKKGIKSFIVALASFLMLVFCIVAASADSSLRFIDPTPANYTQEQDFTGGVLAINTHKSCYLPNEAAFIAIAVLDSEGHMICDADVTLTITDPGNNETVLSTGNGLIKVSPQCCVYGVTNLPDYYTNYTVDGAGTYVMNLTVTAVTADGTGTKSITDVFTVQNSVDFDVARDGATRIYPSVPYVMNFTIKANKNYTGLIREYVPASFVITPQDGLIVTTVGDTKILTWTKNLVKGETYNIYYEFDAPAVSPYLFTLGNLEIGSFKEVRQWQIASDTTVTYYFNARSNSIKWVTNPNDMVDNDLATYASCNKNDGDQLLTGNDCPGTGSGTISKVEIQAYGYVDATGDSVSLQPKFTGGDGDDHQNALTAQTAGWGSVIDITGDTNAPSAWIWSDVTNLDCYVICHHVGSEYAHCAKVWINVTHYTPTLWASYNDPAHENPDDTFSDDKHTVYMHGTGFLTSHEYRVAYYDAGPAGDKIYTDDVGSDGAGTLNSNCVFTSFPTSNHGVWQAIVCERTVTPPSTYDSGWAYIIADDSFTVEESAIPEFPTVIAAIAVCMLCAVAYVVMRRSGGKG